MSPPRSGPLGQLWQEGMQRTHKWRSKREAAQTQRMTEHVQNQQPVGAGVGAGCGGITMGLHLTAEHMQAKVAVADAGLFSKVL